MPKAKSLSDDELDELYSLECCDCLHCRCKVGAEHLATTESIGSLDSSIFWQCKGCGQISIRGMCEVPRKFKGQMTAQQIKRYGHRIIGKWTKEKESELFAELTVLDRLQKQETIEFVASQKGEIILPLDLAGKKFRVTLIK